VVPAARQGVVLCGGDPLACALMGCLPQHPQRLFLITSTPLPKIIPEQVTFEGASYNLTEHLSALCHYRNKICHSCI
jgi:hypothetical protein